MDADAANPALCPGCGRHVDRLRAGHVAILGGEFRYFCDHACKLAHLGSIDTTFPTDVTAEPPRVALAPIEPSAIAPKATTPIIELAAPSPRFGTERVIASDAAGAEDIAPSSGMPRKIVEAAPIEPVRPSQTKPKTRKVERAIVLARFSGIVLGLLAPLFGPLATHSLAPRVFIATCASIALIVRFRGGARDTTEPPRWSTAAPMVLAAIAMIFAAITNDPRAPSFATLLGLVVAATLLVDALFASDRADVARDRMKLMRALDVDARVVRNEESTSVPANMVKVGEHVVVAAGDVCGVDGVIARGEAEVVPWLDAPIDLAKKEGGAIVAGARVSNGTLRVATTWTGDERAFTKLINVPSQRLESTVPFARHASLALTRGAPMIAAVLAIATYSKRGGIADLVATASAILVASAMGGAISAIGIHYARAHLAALGHGIIYKDGAAFDRASHVDIAVLCARGTLLMGEPEIVLVEPLASGRESSAGVLSVEQILSYAAGAESASAHPFASAIHRAAEVRGQRAENVRSATLHAGLGVSALAASGERLLVGSRAFLLQEHVSVAVADTRVSELEALGRSVLFLALGERVVGLIALQDGLRGGARGAVRRLHDARIEPILLSGEARETCETIGRALEIEHLRPEVLPSSRGAEVRALGEGGHVTAVIGHPANDDGALGAADVSVAMCAAGRTPGEWSIALASDDVRDAALSLSLPRETRDRARFAIVAGMFLPVTAVLAILFGVAPLFIAPVSAVVGAAILRVFLAKKR
jgi:Cu+-exporting ATPase